MVRPPEDKRELKEDVPEVVLDRLDKSELSEEVPLVVVYLDANADADVDGVFLEPNEVVVVEGVYLELEPKELKELVVVDGVYLVPVVPKDEYETGDEADEVNRDPSEKVWASISAVRVPTTTRAATIFMARR